MMGVACVIANRARVKDKTPYEIVHEPKQFSCWDVLTPGMMEENYIAVKEIADKLAAECLSLFDITEGALNYLAEWLYESPRCPEWAKGMIVTKKIGRHVFLKPA